MTNTEVRIQTHFNTFVTEKVPTTYKWPNTYIIASNSCI